MATKKKTTVKLVCTSCKSANYFGHKSPKSETKIELSKYCKHCRKRTPHKESKK
ncbi:MAG: 50S ribosomal protein L33 [Candidatus Paceibacterota bacterium]|nr:50S ribosomal protein L33 [Candidatus Paceibacterota bacterium]MDD4831101.1 50S ribosomal protein L33 [Candidatus Paceibacterota bacterium]MDD4875362.1 50S ribosomal protein L33 [Candidatus Paceibacterota bacterium]